MDRHDYAAAAAAAAAFAQQQAAAAQQQFGFQQFQGGPPPPSAQPFLPHHPSMQFPSTYHQQLHHHGHLPYQQHIPPPPPLAPSPPPIAPHILPPQPFFNPWDAPPPPVPPPVDADLQKRIDKLAEYAAKNGPDFEKMIREKQQDNPAYNFLFGAEGHGYYRYKLWLCTRPITANFSHGMGSMNPALTSMGSLNSPLQTLNPPLNPGLSSALNPALSNSLLGAAPPLHHSGPFPAFYDQHPQPPPQHSQPLYNAAELYNAPNFLMQGLAKGASGMAGLSRARLAPPTQRFGASASNHKFALCLPSTGSYTGSFRNMVMAISAKGDWALQHFLSHDQENFKPNPITAGTPCRWSVKKLDIAILEQLHQRGNCAGGTDFCLVFVQRREAEQRGRGVLAGRHRVLAAEHLDHGLDGPFFHNQCFVRLVDALVEERRHGVLLSLGVVALQDVNTVVTTWKGISVMDPVLCQIGRTEVLRDIVYLYKHVLEDFLDLYIADAYFGLLTVGPEGGLATPLTTEAGGVPLRFTNDLDIDDYALERPLDWVVRIRLHVAQQIAGNM